MDRKVRKAIIKICPEAKQAFKDRKDVYAFLASKIFDVPYEVCCPYELKNSEGYKYCENFTLPADLRRKISKSYVLFMLYPSITLINDIQECYARLKNL